MGARSDEMIAIEKFHEAFAALEAAGVSKDLQIIAALKIAAREAHMRFMPEDTFIIIAGNSYRQLVSRIPPYIMRGRESLAADMGFKDSETAERAVRADWKVALVEIDVRQRKQIEEMTGIKKELN